MNLTTSNVRGLLRELCSLLVRWSRGSVRQEGVIGVERFSETTVESCAPCSREYHHTPDSRKSPPRAGNLPVSGCQSAVRGEVSLQTALLRAQSPAAALALAAFALSPSTGPVAAALESRPRRTSLCRIRPERSSAELTAFGELDRPGRLFVRFELGECESPGLSRGAIGRNDDLDHRSRRCEELRQLLLGGVEAEIADEDLRDVVTP